MRDLPLHVLAGQAPVPHQLVHAPDVQSPSSPQGPHPLPGWPAPKGPMPLPPLQPPGPPWGPPGPPHGAPPGAPVTCGKPLELHQLAAEESWVGRE